MRTFLIWTVFPVVCLMAISNASAQRWVELTPASGDMPVARTESTCVYDPVGHRLVLFGGKGGGTHNDVWAFDLAVYSWTRLHDGQGTAPSGRFTADGVYDAGAHSMVIWAGQGSGFFNDAWAFDLTSNTWSRFVTGDPQPNIRYGTASVFDPLARDLVTFAGFTDGGRFQDTWRLDVDAAAWTEVTPASGSPQRRCLHSAVYDSAGHAMIMYGGQTSGPRDDIWRFDLATDTWTDLTPATRPDGRYFAAHVYDARGHRAIIFGGSSISGKQQDVHAFDLADGTWSELLPLGVAPAPRQGAEGIYVESEDRMILFGGNAAGNQNDVWALEDLSGDDAVVCRAGNVNAAAGAVTDVLFINDSAGVGADRTVSITPTDPFSLRIAAPPSNPSGPAPFALYGWFGEPDGGTVAPLPKGTGLLCMSIPLSGAGGPLPRIIWNNLGKEPHLESANTPSQPAPSVLAERSTGIGRSGTFFLQGILRDDGSIQGRAAVTNGLRVVSTE